MASASELMADSSKDLSDNSKAHRELIEKANDNLVNNIGDKAKGLRKAWEEWVVKYEAWVEFAAKKFVGRTTNSTGAGNVISNSEWVEYSFDGSTSPRKYSDKKEFPSSNEFTRGLYVWVEFTKGLKNTYAKLSNDIANLPENAVLDSLGDGTPSTELNNNTTLIRKINHGQNIEKYMKPHQMIDPSSWSFYTNTFAGQLLPYHERSKADLELIGYNKCEYHPSEWWGKGTGVGSDYMTPGQKTSNAVKNSHGGPKPVQAIMQKAMAAKWMEKERLAAIKEAKRAYKSEGTGQSTRILWNPGWWGALDIWQSSAWTYAIAASADTGKITDKKAQSEALLQYKSFYTHQRSLWDTTFYRFAHVNNPETHAWWNENNLIKFSMNGYLDRSKWGNKLYTSWEQKCGTYKYATPASDWCKILSQTTSVKAGAATITYEKCLQDGKPSEGMKSGNRPFSCGDYGPHTSFTQWKKTSAGDAISGRTHVEATFKTTHDNGIGFGAPTLSTNKTLYSHTSTAWEQLNNAYFDLKRASYALRDASYEILKLDEELWYAKKKATDFAEAVKAESPNSEAAKEAQKLLNYIASQKGRIEALTSSFTKNLIFREQCYLLAKVINLARWRAARTKECPYGGGGKNASIVVDASSPFAFVNKLTQDPTQKNLFDLKNHEISSLQPMIKLYKIKFENQSMGSAAEEEIPITFNSHADISSLLNDKSKRGEGVGIQSFSFTYDGSNPFAAKKSIKAKLKIFANTFDELLIDRGSGDQKFKYVDLALKTSNSSASAICKNFKNFKGNNEKFAKLNFRLKAVVGWAFPRGGKMGHFTSGVPDAIYNSFVTLNLTPTVHDFQIDEQGRVVFEINYLAYQDDFFDQVEYTIFNNVDIVSQQKLRKIGYETLKNRCHIDEISALKDNDKLIIGEEKRKNLSFLMKKLLDHNLVYYLTANVDEIKNFQLQSVFHRDVAGTKVLTSDEKDKELSGNIASALKKYTEANQDVAEFRDEIAVGLTVVSPNDFDLPFFYVSDLIDVIMAGIEETLTDMPSLLEQKLSTTGKVALKKARSAKKVALPPGNFPVEGATWPVSLCIDNPSNGPCGNPGIKGCKIYSRGSWLYTRAGYGGTKGETLAQKYCKKYGVEGQWLEWEVLQTCRKVNKGGESDPWEVGYDIDFVIPWSDFKREWQRMATDRHFGSSRGAQDTITTVSACRSSVNHENIEITLPRTAFESDKYLAIDLATPASSADEKKTPYFFASINDCLLIEEILNYERLQAQYKKFRVLLGPVEFVDRKDDVATTTFSLGDLPISVKYFMEFLTEKLSSKESATYTLANFLNDFFNNLIRNFLNDDTCFTHSVNAAQRVSMMSSAITSYKSTGTPRDEIMQIAYNKLSSAQRSEIKSKSKFLSGRIRDTALELPVLSISGKRGFPDGGNRGLDNEMNWMVYYAGRTRPKGVMTGDKKTDELAGIFHYSIGKDRGIVKNIQLQKTQTPGLQEVRFEQDGYDGLRQLRVVYDVNIDSYANVKAFPGTYIFVDPQGFAPNTTLKPGALDNLTEYGIGGYYIVIRSEHNFGPGYANTKIFAKWVNQLVNEFNEKDMAGTKDSKRGTRISGIPCKQGWHD